jgi:hypothetical protein
MMFVPVHGISLRLQGSYTGVGFNRDLGVWVVRRMIRGRGESVPGAQVVWQWHNGTVTVFKFLRCTTSTCDLKRAT